MIYLLERLFAFNIRSKINSRTDEEYYCRSYSIFSRYKWPEDKSKIETFYSYVEDSKCAYYYSLIPTIKSK
jgi:hypothetical protein